MRPVRTPRAAGPQRAVALRAAAVHRLHQEPVDLLAQLDDVGRGDPALAAVRRGEHVFVQRAPGVKRDINVFSFTNSTSSLHWFS